MPLAEAAPAGLLLNAVSLSLASVSYWRGGLVDRRVVLPLLVTGVAFAPMGARLTPLVDRRVLLGLFAAFLAFAGFMMLRRHAGARGQALGRVGTAAAGLGVGGAAGFLGGLLGVGGGNFILPVLTWVGLDAKVAAGTTAVVVLFSSLSGFLGHATLGGLDRTFLSATALMAAAGSAVGSKLMKTRVSSLQLKKVIGGVLWLIAAKMAFDAMK